MAVARERVRPRTSLEQQAVRERLAAVHERDIGVPGAIRWRPQFDNMSIEALGPEWHGAQRPSGGTAFYNDAVFSHRDRPIYMVRAGHGGNPGRMIAIMRTLSASGAGVVGVPTPGYGTELPTQMAPTLLGYANDHVALIDELTALGVDGPYTLVGHSMGGAVNCLVAALRPWQIQRMLLVNAIGSPVPERSDLGWKLAFAGSVLHEPLADLPALLRGVASTAIGPQFGYQMVVSKRCCDSDVSAALRIIKESNIIPVVVQAAGDRVVSKAMAEYMAAESGGVFLQIPHSGHGLLHHFEDDRQSVATMVARARELRLRGGQAQSVRSFRDVLGMFIEMVADERRELDRVATVASVDATTALRLGDEACSRTWRAGVSAMQRCVESGERTPSRELVPSFAMAPA